MNQSEYETLMMAHDNLQRELSDVKRLMGKAKHELIKANIALNRRVQELENHIDHLYDNNVHLKGDYRLQEQNKRYQEALEKIKDKNRFGKTAEEMLCIKEH